MKKSVILFSVCFLALNTNPLLAQQAEQKVLITLQKNEEPMYYESCIPMSFTHGSLKLVTRVGNEYFFYDNGTRKGPFKKTSIPYNDCSEAYISSNCSVFQSESNNYEKFIQNAGNDRVKVVYNGKTYTEFSQITQLAVSANESKIAVLGTNDDWEPLFLTPDGKLIELQGEFQKIAISPSGAVAIVSMGGSEIESSGNTAVNYEKMAAEMESADLSSMTPEEITTFMDNIQAKYGIETNNQDEEVESYLYINSGKKLGPFNFGYATDNPAFCVTGGDNWYFLSENKLFVNGTMIKDFGENAPSLCDVWISADGKRYAAFIGYEKLVFSDGQSYPAPLQIKAEVLNGKAYLTWLCLNPSNQIVLYKKAI